MSKIELVINKIEKVSKEMVIKKIKPNSTFEELADYLEEHPVIDLLVEGIYWFNNKDFDEFLCSLDISSLKVLEPFSNENVYSLHLSCLLVLPEFSKKLISIYPELLEKKTNENYSPIICALNAMKIDDKMEEVVLMMLNNPKLCLLDQIHNVNKEKKVYIWEYVCRNGYENIVRKMYNECLDYFKIDDTLSIPENNTPLLDLIIYNIEDIAVKMVKNQRDKCYLDKDYGGMTPLLSSLLKCRKELIIEILERYDDCYFDFVYTNGISAFELLFAYGFHGVILDILENHRNLYYNKFVHSKAKSPFELALYQKNWDLAAILVAYKFIPLSEITSTFITGIPLKQYLTINNQNDLLKFFAYVETKYGQPKPPTINESDPGWQKIKELGLDNLIKDILKDPIAYASTVKDGKINFTHNGMPTTINFNKTLNGLPSDFATNITKSFSSLLKNPDTTNETKNVPIQKQDIKSLETKSKLRKKQKDEPIQLEIENPISKFINTKDLEVKSEPKKRGRPRKIKPEE